MLKVNSSEKPERRRSVVSFAEEATVIGVSEEAEGAEKQLETGLFANIVLELIPNSCPYRLLVLFTTYNYRVVCSATQLWALHGLF